MNVWTPNKQDSPHLFSMAVSYKVSLHLCDYLSLDQYNKQELHKINFIRILFIFLLNVYYKTFSSEI